MTLDLGRGLCNLFLGACTFIIAYVIFCQCPTRHLAQAFNHGSSVPAINVGATTAARAAHLAEKDTVGWAGGGAVATVFGSGLRVGGSLSAACFCSRLVNCFARLLAALAWLAALVPFPVWVFAVKQDSPFVICVVHRQPRAPLCPWDWGA